MYQSDKHISLTTIILFAASAISTALNAKDFGPTTLNNTIGATDYYKVTCAENTDHLQLSVIDQTLLAPPAPQLLNVHLSKDALISEALAIQPGTPDQSIAVLGGIGKYQVIIDTQGTNTSLTKAQSFKFSYQCNYADGTIKKHTSGIATIKNDKKSKYTFTCAEKKRTSRKPAVGVDGLEFTLMDKTKPAIAEVSKIILNAQVSKCSYATSTSDTNGDQKYSPAVNLTPPIGQNCDSTGDYFISVDDTGTQANQNNSKQYAIKYSCMDKANLETTTADAIIIQDQ